MLEAVNGEEGIAQAELHRPDLILMDIQLPRRGRLRRHPAHQGLTRPCATFRSSPSPPMRLAGDEAKTREAGCDGYVAKPFSPRKLLAKVQEFLA